MEKKVFITRKIPEIGIKMLKDKGYQVDVFPKDRAIEEKEFVKILSKGNYDAVVCLLTEKINSKILEASPSVKIYANYATGFDNIDVSLAKQKGVTITNAPAESTTEAVAEHTLAIMLALSLRIVEADYFTRGGGYKGWSPTNLIGNDLSGKTLGIVGGGRIGGRVAYFAKGLGIKVIYHDVSRNEYIEKETGAKFCESLDELLGQSDFVSLHVPLLDSTRHLMNAETLKKMKPTAFLINTSRGPVVDEGALISALENGVIAGAGLDVFEFEPKIPRGLRKLCNVVLTPHIASASVNARNEMSEIVAGNIIDFFEGRTPKNILN